MTDSSVISDPPQVSIDTKRPSEKELYKMMWVKDEYRIVSPGERYTTNF